MFCDRSGCVKDGPKPAIGIIRWRWTWFIEPSWQDYPVCAACKDILWPGFQEEADSGKLELKWADV